MDADSPSVFRFGEFELDTANGILRGPGGTIALRPKSMDLLAYLLRNAGRVVPKDELLDAVWAGLTVTEESLSQCIHDIRRALADTGQDLLRTVPRRGYLFPAEKLMAEKAVAQPPPLVSRAASRISIAVIPFASIGGLPESNFFAAGMTEDIVTALSRIGELFVIAPAASFAARGHTASFSEIAADLGARYVLSEDKEENLRRAGDYAGRALAVDPLLGSAHMLLGGIAFLRDLHDEALAHCERAVTLAPSDSFALAYLGLVCSYSRRALRGIEVLKTALRLSPQPLAWYYESLSNAHLWAGQFDEAIATAEVNFKLQPEEPLSYVVLAVAYGFAGRAAEAVAAIEGLRASFPGYSLKDIRISERYAYQQDLEKVIATLRAAGLVE